MIIKPIKTRKFWPPQDDLWGFLDASLPKLTENAIVVAASKVVAIGEGRCILASRVKDKDELIMSEADRYLPRELVPNRWVMHTLKNGILLPSAGLDESNANGYYILWPKNSMASAKTIWRFLRQCRRLKNLGVIIADSHSTPLRRGVMGLALGWQGFKPLRDYRGTRDIFGRGLVFSQSNIVDSLASAAAVVMGEGNEQTPLAVISNVPFVKFTSRESRASRRRNPEEFSDVMVGLEEDIYRPFLKSVKWRKGGGG